MLQVPVGDGGIQQGLGQRQAGIIDHNVDAAEGEQCGVNRRLHRHFISHIRGNADGHVAIADLSRGGLRLVGVKIGDHYTGPFGRQPDRDRLADS